MTTILSIGRDPSLMAIRTMILHQAGYPVTEAYSSKEALQHLRSARFDLMLICHTVPESEHEELVAAIRLLQPGLQMVSIRPNEYQPPTREHCATVDNVAPAFLADLNAVLRKTGQRRIS